ncbi:signal peptidase I [unidentified eubacterium SCB49]|nr:signal peptidase I [unidentified eubacterium SCB49]
MSWTGWLIFFLVIQVIHFIGTWKLYVKAGRQAWEAAVPVYNAVVLMKIINRPWWWTILLFIPIVNLIMFPVIWVETIRSFGRNSTADTWLAILTLGLYTYYISYTQDVTYIEDRSLQPKSTAGEWISSILFAIVAATIVHTYFMQPFTIPTSSLEKTLLVGDFLFVSKFHYGARTPMTPMALPMVHDTIPKAGLKSYLSYPEIPYFRLPGFQDISRNDIVVFNWPIDEFVDIGPPAKGYAYKPIDKKSNYVKRCVGIPGDSLEVRDGYVFIDGEKNDLPDRARLQFNYGFRTKGQINNPVELLKRYDITDAIGVNREQNHYILSAATEEAVDQLKANPNIAEVFPLKQEKGIRDPGVFPQDEQYNWNTDNFGPILIPKAGMTVDIDTKSIPLYKRIIEVYEGSEMGTNNEISVNGNQVLLNGRPLTSYTFQQDYYWMMGDNRNNSQDARMWGYVPFNHVVGKPVFVWMSIDSNAKGISNKIRWERLFTTVGGEGKPVSYLYYFIAGVIVLFGINFFRKRKKA